MVVRAWLMASLRRRGRWVPLVVALLAVLGAVQLSSAMWQDAEAPTRWLLAGAHVPALIVRGEWWRQLTWPLLHADLAHLLTNLLMLWLLGRPLEAAYGGARLWLLSVAATFTAGLAMLAHPAATWTVGASGIGFGWMGAWVGLGVQLWPWLGTRLALMLVGLPAVLLVVTSVLPADGQLDGVAHAGGALGGLIMALVLRPQRLPLPALSGRRWPWAGRTLRWAGWLAAVMWGVAIAAAIGHRGERLDLPRLATTALDYDQLHLQAPAQLPRGTWSPHDGQCRGEATDPAWALRTGRLACWRLPYSGVLLFGPKSALFTLDAGDVQAFAASQHRGVWVLRQPGVLVAAVAPQWTWTVLADPGLLPTYRRWLAPLVATGRGGGTDSLAKPTELR